MSSKSRALTIDLFQVAVTEAFPDVPDPPVPVTVSAKFGDYQFNGAMGIAGILKGQGIKMAPRDIAVKILEKLPTTGVANVRKETLSQGELFIWIRPSYYHGVC